jgi:P27 family predicted phage terminase small subunit
MGGVGSGRPRKPTRLHAIEGTEKSRHKNWTELEVPDPEGDDLEPPEWLCAQAAQVWRDDLEFLMKLGIIKKTDLRAFALYCSEWDEWFKAKHLEAQRGKYTKNGNGSTVEAPWSKRKEKAMLNIRSWQVQFGLTPATRSKIDAGEQGEEKKSKLEELLSGGMGTGA